MAKMMKSRKLRKRVRKTLGALFLASAIAVAAIPVDDLQASTGAGGALGVTLTEPQTPRRDTDSTIPKIDANERIYATGDGTYQFAYVNPNPSQAGGNKVAVLVGYSSSGHTLDGGNLAIPDTVNVYDKYTDNQGSSEGYVAVGRNLRFLFWRRTIHESDPITGELLYEEKEVEVTYYPLMDGSRISQEEYDKNPTKYSRKPLQDKNEDGSLKFDDEGNPVYVKDLNGNIQFEPGVVEKEIVKDLDRPITHFEFEPCYYRTKDIEGGWGTLADPDNPRYDEFYALNEKADGTLEEYDKLDESKFHLTRSSEEQWIVNVAVEYIGNQTVNSQGVLGPWITDDIAQGVFSGNGNIVNLKVGPNLKGIGDYAFYRCTGLQSITLSNNLETIGNHAFDSCLNIKEITVDPNCNMRRIGNHAFYNCQSLQSFVMPTPVEAIGDGAFENCYALNSIELYSQNRVTALTTIGDHAFKNCRSLTKLVIPNNVIDNSSYAAGNSNKGDKLTLGIVEGCTALQSITLMNENADFAEDAGGYGFESFKAQMLPTFYFEGANTADSNNVAKQDTLHRTANDNSIAFKYLGSDVYEIVKTDEDGKKAIYRVNSNNELIFCWIEKGMTNIDMPSTIGPYNIRAISETSFQHNCFLERVKIPSSVQTIAPNAFLGCHQLKHVIFEGPVQCTIGTNAFKTQDAAIHQAGCPYDPATGSQQLPSTPELTFTGDISYASGPFDYAMNPSNNINVGSQERTYIKYYSGWPTNLTVQYNPNTDKNELIDYPILEDLGHYNLDSYPYMTQEYVAAAQAVADKLKNGGVKLTDYEQEIADSALNIELPQGIESVRQNLFVEKEAKETQNVEKSITTNSISEILPGTFKGCTNLKNLNIFGDTSSIGDYAFEDCEKLQNVEISANVNHMGLRPFAGCPNVTYVSFQGGSNFVCEDSIIYGLNGGNKSTVVECLESRGNVSGATSVKADELAGITGIAEEAFYDCSGVGSVDLTQSSIDKVPPYAFAATTGSDSTLYSVYLPKTCQQIQKNAFKNSAVRYVEIPGSVSYIDLDAFNTDRNSPKDAVDEEDNIARERPHSIDFYCEPGSAANIYASNHENINISDKPIELEFTVTFGVVNPNDFNDVRILDTQTVKGGEDAVPPTPPEFDGYTFQGWQPDYHAVAKDLDVKAFYKANNPEDSKLTVTFMDEDGVTVLGTDSVFPGEDAKPPVAPDKEGYRFVGWVPSYTGITQDTTVYARYEKVDSDETRFIVNFYAWNQDTGRNDLLIATQRIAEGEKITDPRVPERPGYRFTGWLPDVSNITSNVDTYAQYDYAGLGAPTPTPDPNATPNPNATPTPVPGSSPTPNPNATPGPTANPNATASPSPSPAPGIYTLTVRNGSGSGSYIEGATVIVIADNPPNNSEFSGWTVEPATAVVASKDALGTVLIMPNSNVTMTANYKSKTGTGSSTVTRPSGGTGNGNGTGTSTGSSNGTTVVINKNGLSNTGVVSVTVNGSSDNFVVKISEDANATDAALRALMSEYSDMTKIAYFPMDISLYDSTGTNKITDTLGLAVNITLPIPDSLIQYAGNNKVASVVNGQLEKLTPKFTTISGVPCISFTATHFSPYVIYVDTQNLTEAAIRDDTPKTGDGIHPKWFLAMGLACISFILFIKKDKRAVPVKVAAAR